MTEDLRRAMDVLIEVAPAFTVSTPLLFEMALKRATISPETLRFAYWTLVADGVLERTSQGVKKAAA